MASTSPTPLSSPAKPLPLHNFELPELKWNKAGQPSFLQKRRRSSIKPPSQRPNASPAPPSPLQRPNASPTPPSPSQWPNASLAPPSPSQESISVTSPLAQSPLKDSAALQSRDFLMKHSPAHGESSKPSPNQAGSKNEMVGGDELGKVLSTLLQEESNRHFQKRDTTSDSVGLKKGKGILIEYRRNYSKSFAFSKSSIAFSSVKIGENSERIDKKIEKKVEKRSKTIENHDSVNKNSKITIKIGNKNSKEEEEEEKNSNLGLLKTPINAEFGKTPINAQFGKTAINAEFGKTLINAESDKSGEPGKTDERGEEHREPGKIGEPGKTDERGKMEEESREEEVKIKNDADDETRIWDLRPRKPKSKSKSQKATNVAERTNSPKLPEKSKAQTQTKNAKAKEAKSSKEKKEKDEKKEKGEKSEKEKKLTINISLTKEEIEEDIFALTGAKSARRPKKRPKNVQKQLDFVFPGQWLVSITPESYKVSESSMKG